VARKSVEVRITAEGRDKGKTFFLTEMSAASAEAWAIRAMGAMARAGSDISLETLAGGAGSMTVLVAAGMKAFLAAPWEDIEPLLAELFGCVQIQPDPGHPEVRRPLVGDDVEEIDTRIRLRDEVIRLHVGFSLADTLLTAVSAMTPAEDESLSDMQIPLPLSEA
jgi:hypothetical protein